MSEIINFTHLPLTELSGELNSCSTGFWALAFHGSGGRIGKCRRSLLHGQQGLRYGGHSSRWECHFVVILTLARMILNDCRGWWQVVWTVEQAHSLDIVPQDAAEQAQVGYGRLEENWCGGRFLSLCKAKNKVLLVLLEERHYLGALMRRHSAVIVSVLYSRLGFFFHRFCGIKHNRFSETLSLGDKSLSLGYKSLSLGKILELRRIFLRFYTEKPQFLPKISQNFPDFWD